MVDSTRRRWLRLAPEVTAPRAARDFVASACAAWLGKDSSELCQLVISELVSNAVMHAGTEIDVEVRRLEQDRVLLRVHDDGDGMPAIVPASQRAIGGVGLDLVSRVALSWGVTPDPRGGKDVWCVLPGATANDPTTS